MPRMLQSAAGNSTIFIWVGIIAGVLIIIGAFAFLWNRARTRRIKILCFDGRPKPVPVVQ